MGGMKGWTPRPRRGNGVEDHVKFRSEEGSAHQALREQAEDGREGAGRMAGAPRLVSQRVRILEREQHLEGCWRGMLVLAVVVVRLLEVTFRELVLRRR